MSDTPLKLVKTMTKYVSETSIEPGQFIYCTDTYRCFYDTGTNARIEIDFEYNTEAFNTSEINNRKRNKVYYLENVHNFYIYEGIAFVKLTSINQTDSYFGVDNLVPFTMSNPMTGMKLAPRTLASAVYTSTGESVEDLLVKGYRLETSVVNVLIEYNRQEIIKIPYPFTPFDVMGNHMDVFYNGFRLNEGYDYSIELKIVENPAEGEDAFYNVLKILETSIIKANDIFTFVFTYNAETVRSSENYNTVIDGGYLANNTVPTKKLAKVTDNINVSNSDTLVTAKALNKLYNKMLELYKITKNTNMYVTEFTWDATNHKFVLATQDDSSITQEITELPISTIRGSTYSFRITATNNIVDRSYSIIPPNNEFFSDENSGMEVFYNGIRINRNDDYIIDTDNNIFTIPDGIEIEEGDLVTLNYIYNSMPDAGNITVVEDSKVVPSNNVHNIYLVPPYEGFFEDSNNITEVYYNGIKINNQSDYTIEDNFIKISNAVTTYEGDIISILFIYNKDNPTMLGYKVSEVILIQNTSRVVNIPFPFNNYLDKPYNLMRVFYNGMYLTKDIDYIINETTISFSDDIDPSIDDLILFEFIYEADKIVLPEEESDSSDDTIITRKTIYNTVSTGDSDLIVVTLTSLLALEDGTEINVRLNTDLHNQAKIKINDMAPLNIYLNNLTTTSVFKYDDIIKLVYSASDRCFNVKIYSDYYIKNYTYYTNITDDNISVVEFDIPKFIEGITPIRVYQNNLRLFDAINYTIKDNTIHLLGYTATKGDNFYFEVDSVEQYFL